MSADQTLAPGVPHRTQPIGLLINAVGLLRQLVFPLIIAVFTLRDGPMFAWLFAGGGVALVAGSLALSYLSWSRRTFTIGEQDIRVESGVLSRSAASVPYERIQDVSLEQKFLARLLGLVAVKFETGAGGADELSLKYMTQAEGEHLRRLVRERREEEAAETRHDASDPGAGSDTQDAVLQERAQTLFSMDPRRLLTFGTFEFSLAVFAVLGGVLQYLDTLFEIEIWDVSFWRSLAEESGGWLLELGAYAQVIGAIVGLILVAFIGLVTGLARTFSREWGFLLERTARGFRRRRGLFTRTDVVMPVHRVQGLTIGTRIIRYRFGWHNLKFVSLAQDAGSSSHVVAPFAQLEELDPIVEAAGFSRPSPEAQWHRAARAWLNVTIAIDLAIFAVVTLIAGVATTIFAPEWTLVAIIGPLAVAVITLVAEVLSWQFKKHALENDQIASMSGLFAPKTKVAKKVKLHSVEIVQGPFAKKFGYATLNLGMAGGEMEIEGVELERARAVRSMILQTMTQTDFSQLESADSHAAFDRAA